MKSAFRNWFILNPLFFCSGMQFPEKDCIMDRVFIDRIENWSFEPERIIAFYETSAGIKLRPQGCG